MKETITTSHGRPAIINGVFAGLYGSGYGKHKGLLAEADKAAALLAKTFGLPIEKRGNSDGKSAGAYHDQDITYSKCPNCHRSQFLIQRKRGRNVHYTLPGRGSWIRIEGRGQTICLACGTACTKASSAVYSQTWYGLGAWLRNNGTIEYDALIYVRSEEYLSFCQAVGTKPDEWTVQHYVNQQSEHHHETVQCIRYFPTLTQAHRWLMIFGPKFCPALKGGQQ